MKDEKFNPKVSIIIPVYNGSNYIGEAIDSALAQTYENIEIIVVNDGSTDNTEEIVKRYGNKLRYLKKENGGVSTALNLAIEKSEGEYISWLSHDDLYAPDKIKLQILALNDKSREAIIFCDYKFIDANGNFLADANLNEKASSSIHALLALDTKTGLHGCSLLISKLAINQVGGFDPKLEITQDYDLWFKLSKRYPFVHVKQQLVLSRRHPGQDSKTRKEKALSDADSHHAKLISSLKDEDIDKYIEDLDYYIEAYNDYRDAGYRKTTRSMLQLFCRCKKFNNQKIKRLINEETFQLNAMANVDKNIVAINKLTIFPKNKPIIVFYSYTWSSGGVERVISLLAKELSSKYQIIIISEFGINDVYPTDKSILKLNFNPKENYVPKLVNLVCMLKTDIFIGTHVMAELIDIYGLLREEGVKTIVCVGMNYFLPILENNMYPIWKKKKEAFKLASCVIWPIKFAAFLYRINSSYNVTYIPYPTTFEQPQELLEKNPNNKIIMVCRADDKLKRIDRALLMFKKVLDKNPNCELIIVGRFNKNWRIPLENPETIGEMIKRLQFTDIHIKIIGETDKVQDYYNGASVLIMTSETEGFGMVLVEAHSHGLPTVVFQIPGIEDIVQNGVNGFVVPQGEIGLMADNVNELLRDKQLYRRLSINAQQNVSQFSLQKVGQKWMNLIDVLLKNNDQEKINAILSGEFSSFMNEPLNLRGAINMYERIIDELQQKHDDLQQEHDDLQQEHDDLQQKHDDLQQEHDDLQQEHDDLQQEHTQLKQRHLDLLNSRAVRFACKLSYHPTLLKMARICYSMLKKIYSTYLFCRRSSCKITDFVRSFIWRLKDYFIINQFNPKVSIIIPVYNGSNYIGEAIDSALAQTYKSIEIIVVNDGSTDNTEEIVKRYGNKLRYFKKENGGVSTALNLAIEKSEGEYISWLSHDDVYYSNKISEQIRCLNKYNNKDLILYSNVEYIDEKSNLINKTAYEDTHTPDHLNSGLYALTKGLTNGCSLLIPKICFNNVGMFDEEILTSSDYDMWFRLLKSYEIRFIPKVLIKHRLHGQSGTNTSSVYIKEANKTWIKILNDLSAEDISKIEASPFSFYQKMANQMKASLFYDAYNCALNIAKNLYKTPKLTVIMLSYNTEKYLSEAIESILNQSFCDFELIIVDDSSTDNSWQIINKYKENDFRIIALRNKKNLGMAESINIGLNIARGEYITRMDSDDISLPQRLEKQISFLDNNKKYGLCSVNMSSMDNKGQQISSALYKETSVPLEWLVLWQLPIASAPSMYRREIITKHSIINNCNYKIAEDYDFLCRITLHTRIFKINEVLYKYRIHTKSIYQRNKPLVYKNSIDVSRNFAKLLTGVNPPVCHDYFNVCFNLLDRKPEKRYITEISSWMNKLLMISKKRWNWSDKEYRFARMDANSRIKKV